MSNLPESRVVHGALDYSELVGLGLQPEEMLDFSVNSNPYGPSPHVREAIAKVALDRYPDCECLQLRRAILTYELSPSHLSFSSIVCGNGSNELIWAIARAHLTPERKALIIGPTFGEYHAACHSTGATIIEMQTSAVGDFQPEIPALCTLIYAERPSLVWLCNPNNPTGVYLNRQQIRLLAATCEYAGTLLVIDESYRHFVIPDEDFSAIELLHTSDQVPVVVVRSLTKDFALAALRLGYAVSTPSLVKRIEAYLPAWNVSGVAQAAGCAALADRIYLHTMLNQLAIEREAFFEALQQEANLQLVPSRTHFCLVDVGDAQRVRQQLLLHKIMVRDCSSFGLPRFMRVSTRPRYDWQRLLQALQGVV